MATSSVRRLKRQSIQGTAANDKGNRITNQIGA
jgi:hypothetical protein